MLGLVTDALSLPLARFNSFSALYQRFDKVWPKTTLYESVLQPDGTYEQIPIQVYQGQLTFYQGGQYVYSDRMKKFIQALGMRWDEFTSQSMDSEIERVYFTLPARYKWDGSVRPGGTPELPDTDEDELTKAQIVEAMNAGLKTGDVIEVTVAYGGATHRYIQDHYLGWIATGLEVQSSALNSPVIRDILNSDPWFYFANIRDDGTIDKTVQWQTIKDGENDIPTNDGGVNRVLSNAPVCDVASTVSEWGIFALMKDTRTFEPIGDIYDERISTVHVSDEEGEALQYSYKQKYKYTEVNEESTIVEELYARWQQVKIAMDSSEPVKATRSVTSSNNVQIDTKAKKTIIGLAYQQLANKTNSLYFNGYLRVDAAAKMKRADFANMLSKNLDTGYDVEEADWWEKALAVVIVIVAVVVGFLVGGPVGASQGFAAGAAAGLSAAAVTLTLGSMMLANIGGLSSTGLVKKIGNIAEIVGYAAMIAGITAALQGAWNAARDQLVKEGVKEATTSQVLGKMISMAVDSAVSSVKNAITSAMNPAEKLASMSMTEVMSAINSAVKTVGQALEMYQDKEKRELEAEYAAMEKEKEEYENASNILKDPLGVLTTVQAQTSAYDAIDALRIATDNKIGLGTFNKWNAERKFI